MALLQEFPGTFRYLRERDQRGRLEAAGTSWQQPSEDMQEKGEEDPGIAEETRPPRHRSGRTSLPCGSGDQPRYSGADHLLRHGRADRGFHLPSACSWSGPLIVMDQWMYHSRLYAAANYVKTTEQSGSDPAELLRLRSGRRYHRPGQRYSDQLRQDLYLLEDRRGQQPGCRPYPYPLPVWPPSASGRRTRRSARVVSASLQPCGLHRGDAKRLHDPLSPDVTDPFRPHGARLQCLRLPPGGSAGY